MASKKGNKAQEEFREEQRRAARSQNQGAENAVPEQRPIASQVSSLPESDVRKRLRENGELQEEPMPKSAYDKADSKSQDSKADKASQHETFRAGQRVKVTGGPYEGSFGAIVEVNYDDFEERQKARSGDPSVARFAQPSSYQVRTRGGNHALITLDPDDVEFVEDKHYERGVA